jgi:hypothetical protein
MYISKKRLEFPALLPGAVFKFLDLGIRAMTDQQLALEEVGEAQRILEEYLQPRPKNYERILDKLVEVLEQPRLVVAVSRFERKWAVK